MRVRIERDLRDVLASLADDDAKASVLRAYVEHSASVERVRITADKEVRLQHVRNGGHAWVRVCAAAAFIVLFSVGGCVGAKVVEVVGAGHRGQ